jgi:hypothetical protein
MPVVGLGRIPCEPGHDGFERSALAGFGECFERGGLGDLVGIGGPKRFRELAP